MRALHVFMLIFQDLSIYHLNIRVHPDVTILQLQINQFCKMYRRSWSLEATHTQLFQLFYSFLENRPFFSQPRQFQKISKFFCQIDEKKELKFLIFGFLVQIHRERLPNVGWETSGELNVKSSDSEGENWLFWSDFEKWRFNGQLKMPMDDEWKRKGWKWNDRVSERVLVSAWDVHRAAHAYVAAFICIIHLQARKVLRPDTRSLPKGSTRLRGIGFWWI